MFIDVAHVEADLIHVRCNEHARWCLTTLLLRWLARADKRSNCIGVNCVEETLDFLLHERTNALFAPRNSCGLTQSSKKVVVHEASL